MQKSSFWFLAVFLYAATPNLAASSCTSLDGLALSDLPGSCDPEWNPDPEICPDCFRPNFAYPTVLPDEEDLPWADTDFTSEPVLWLNLVLDYALEGFDIAGRARWDVFDNSVRTWYHAPWMHPHDHDGSGERFDFEPLDRPQAMPFKYGPVRTGREYLLGLTEELQSFPHFLGAAQSNERTNWAVSFFNPRAAYTLYEIWDDGSSSPELVKDAEFAPGSVFVKPLYTTATTAEAPFLKGAPTVIANTSVNRFETWNRQPSELSLIQFDVAVKYDTDTFAELTGLEGTLTWVYGTFVYDARMTSDHSENTWSRKRPIAWSRLRPIGVTWGNDPELEDCDAEGRPKESIVLLNASDLGIALNARAAHKTCAENNQLSAAFGREGRLNGPVDGVNSSCISCHGAAQFRRNMEAISEDFKAELARAPWPDFDPIRATLSDKELWKRDSCLFLNRVPGQPLGDFLPEKPDDCQVNENEYQTTDTSLQLAFGLSRYCKFILRTYAPLGQGASEDLIKRAKACSPKRFEKGSKDENDEETLKKALNALSQLESFTKGSPSPSMQGTNR